MIFGIFVSAATVIANRQAERDAIGAKISETELQAEFNDVLTTMVKNVVAVQTRRTE